MIPKEVNDETPYTFMEFITELGCKNMTDFAKLIDCNVDSVRGWVKGRTKNPSLTIPQWKRLAQAMQEKGIPLEKLPNDFKEKP
jgi:hypothetical protein